MDAAGYDVSFQEFTFPYYEVLSPPIFEQVAPTLTSYVSGVDFQLMMYSASGDVTAELAVPAGSPLGCAAGDWAGFPAERIALVQRGACTFQIKADNAAAAGALGVVVYNNVAGLLAGRLGEPGNPLPIIGTTDTLGAQLLALVPSGVTVHLQTDTISQIRETANVIAETPGGDPNHVVVVGAHLDSRVEGPGINDNGSGSAAILEVAEVFAAQDREPRNKLRFMWFGAEEFGLLGSTHYVANLSDDELDRIEMMLNFDMVGSPNFVRFIYDGDNSAFPPGPGAAEGPPGSDVIEQAFADFFESEGLATEETPFSGRSDYGPFIAVGIPAGGLFTGAEGIKTAAQAATYGGTAGVAYDPCYHLACDTYANNNDTVLDQNADAIAHMVLLFSKRNFDKEPLN
jgi:Zn-dependent M28 family amino/carboxypeptidase